MEAVQESFSQHREACGYSLFSGADQSAEVVREILNKALPNEHVGKSVSEIPSVALAVTLRYVTLARSYWDEMAIKRAGDTEAVARAKARHDVAVTLSLDLEYEITKRLGCYN